ncbi:hemolytic protein HlpA [soil metagenome]
MHQHSTSVPIVLIVFNRPSPTKSLLSVVTRIQPSKVFIIADGPRPNHPTDRENCQATRDLIDKAQWKGEVLTNYADVNLGCKARISTGLSWVFDQVDQAIILEDDCLPHPSFFRFCHELLEYYREDERVMAISGDNFQFGRRRTQNSYYFSRYPHCWGWATWKRAWQHYDADMTLWPQAKSSHWLDGILHDAAAVKYWHHKFEQTYTKKIDTWDYAWTLACWLQSGLCILPNTNLVSNIGFDAGGTHHTHSHSPFSNMPTVEMPFPLNHPPTVLRNAQADRFTQAHQFGLLSRSRRKVRAVLNL